MMRGKRIDLQLTQRLFTNRRELNQTLFKFIDFEFKYVFFDTTKIREREKKIRGRHTGWVWVYSVVLGVKLSCLFEVFLIS